ncbi:MAG: hypothetical protein EPO11_09040 [Gammaproteobacteria bacterium]|nr:MAG: hypothetical protein EPO11_09040 [Gammaproteobacteria bacterium]
MAEMRIFPAVRYIISFLLAASALSMTPATLADPPNSSDNGMDSLELLQKYGASYTPEQVEQARAAVEQIQAQQKALQQEMQKTLQEVAKSMQQQGIDFALPPPDQK